MEPKGIHVTQTNQRVDMKLLLHSFSNRTKIFNNTCINLQIKGFQSPLHHGWECFPLANLTAITT